MTQFSKSSAVLFLFFLHCVCVFVHCSKLEGVSSIDIQCNSNNIKVTVETSEDFNGMIYPKGLAKNTSCLVEYDHTHTHAGGSKISYEVPLKSCNTMSHDLNNEGIEYFNTIVIQPHNKLVTDKGKGFHVRCRYTKDINNSPGVDVSTTHNGKTSISRPHDTTVLPNCHMRIYSGRPEEHHIAEHVRIGDYLTMIISIDEQDVYGLMVTNCIVHDGLNWAEQPLINNVGCPLDPDIMGPFEYSKNLTSAYVTYPAHKFPFVGSVYYQCNVKLCHKKSGGCDDVPPVCDEIGNNVRRRRKKRASEREGGELLDQGNLDELKNEDIRDRSFDVYSGLYVNEIDELGEEDNPSPLSSRSDDEFCVSSRKFAIGIAIAGVLLTLAVILLVACIVHRRRRRKGSSTAGSSIYSGPYSNHAYSRD